MVDYQISEQDYLEFQETVSAYAQANQMDEDLALARVDDFLSEPEENTANALFIWQALSADELGLVALNPQLIKIKDLSRVQFRTTYNLPLYH